eukprot:6199054-Pleurochrysis_carterae.AAC.2
MIKSEGLDLPLAIYVHSLQFFVDPTSAYLIGNSRGSTARAQVFGRNHQHFGFCDFEQVSAADVKDTTRLLFLPVTCAVPMSVWLVNVLTCPIKYQHRRCKSGFRKCGVGSIRSTRDQGQD